MKTKQSIIFGSWTLHRNRVSKFQNALAETLWHWGGKCNCYLKPSWEGNQVCQLSLCQGKKTQKGRGRSKKTTTTHQGHTKTTTVMFDNIFQFDRWSICKVVYVGGWSFDRLVDWLGWPSCWLQSTCYDVHLSYNLYLLALYMLFCRLVFLWTEFD